MATTNKEEAMNSYDKIVLTMGAADLTAGEGVYDLWLAAYIPSRAAGAAR